MYQVAPGPVRPRVGMEIIQTLGFHIRTSAWVSVCEDVCKWYERVFLNIPTHVSAYLHSITSIPWTYVSKIKCRNSEFMGINEMEIISRDGAH